MQYTTNHNLNKPDGSDFAKIEALNENADIIDALIKELQDNKANGTDLTTLRDTVTKHLEETESWQKYKLTSDDGNVKSEVITIADLNNLRDTGTYRLILASTADNIPAGTYTVEVLPTYHRVPTQRLTSTTQASEVILRTYVSASNTWITRKYLLDTHTQTPQIYEATLINGFGGSIKYQKLAHNIVRLNVFIETITSSTALTVLTTLPTGFRPTATVPIPCYLGNLTPYEAKIPFVVKANGEITIIIGNGLSASTAAGVRGEVLYYAGV